MSRVFAVFLGLALFSLCATVALAHPLGNFTINHYARLETSTDAVRIRYALDFAEIPTFQEKQNMDSDGNGEISDAERETFLDSLLPRVVENLTLDVGGTNALLHVVPGSAQLEFLPGQGGLEVLRIALWLDAPVDLQAMGSALHFRDDNYRERLGWREIVVIGAEGVAISDSNASAHDISAELTNYPEDMLDNPLNHREVTYTAVPDATAAPAPASNAITTGGLGAFDRTRDEFGKLLTDNRDLTPSALAIAFLAAIALGALHAFSPGHGKAVVAAYLVGSRGNWQHALFLGVVVTATHTAGVYALGFVTLFLSAYILPEQLFPWLGFASGLLVALIGIRLFSQRLRASRSQTTAYNTAFNHVHNHSNGHSPSHPNVHIRTHGNGHTHSHDAEADHDHAPTHEPEHFHVHADGTTHSHPHAEDSHSHAELSQPREHEHAHVPSLGKPKGVSPTAELTHDHYNVTPETHVPAVSHHHSHIFATPEEEEAHARAHLDEIEALEKPSWKNLVSLGVSGGLLPCPSALVVMLSAIALGRVLYGLFLIVGFSLGLAAVLVLTGLALLYAGKFAGSVVGGQKMGWFLRYVPIVGAGFVAILGIGIALESLMQTSFLP